MQDELPAWAAGLFDDGPVVLLAFDAAQPHRLRHASPNLQRVRGRDSEAVPVGAPLQQLMHADDVALLQRRGTTVPGAQVRLAHADGRWRRCALHVAADAPDADALRRCCLIELEALQRGVTPPQTDNADLQAALQRVSAAQRFMETLQHLSELLQACDSEAQARRLIAEGGPQLFARWDGAMTFAGAHAAMEVASCWGRFEPPAPSLQAECWAVRRRKLHRMDAAPAPGELPTHVAPVCSHFGSGAGLPPGVTHALCMPLALGRERAGALHLITRAPMDESELRAAGWGIDALAGMLKLSLANLRLRISLREQAVRDWLTGLYNRRYFDHVLQQEINRSERGHERLTLALLDIDHFKSFNDTYGHEAGDEVIRSVATQLLGFGRSYDIACRVGGEELAVLMPRASLEETCARLDRLRERIAALGVTHKGTKLPPVTVSIGVAAVGEHGASEDLLHRADAALYAAKHDGRNRVTCWSPEIEAASSFGNFGDAERVVSHEGGTRSAP